MIAGGGGQTPRSALVLEHVHAGIPVADEDQAFLGHIKVGFFSVKADVGARVVEFFGMGGTQEASSLGANWSLMLNMRTPALL